MEANQFDLITRQLGRSTGRRAIVRTLFAGGLGLLALGRAKASAGYCREAGELCNRDSHCCSGGCLPRDRAGRRRCACAGAYATCDGLCVNLQTDRENCGSCGNVCHGSPSQSIEAFFCESGVCHNICEAIAGTTLCGGVCVDLQTDAQHCGTCANDCTTTPGGTCVAGSCAVAA